MATIARTPSVSALHLKDGASDAKELNMPGIMSRLLPKVISPRTHGVIDYAVAGTNLVAGVLFRRNGNHRASNAAFALGAGILANALMTDYPLGVFRRYSFRVHGALDYGIVAAAEAMPRLLGIEPDPEARFFKWQGTGEAAIAAMSDYTDPTGARHYHGKRREWRRAA